jgi:cytoplasmic iron level regulating protein YaaA (DUF328/UPF0246 family)
MRRTIVLVSCVKDKQKVPSPAQYLYTSPLFKKMSAYARKFGDEWYILSAKYGLVHPDEIIAPYNDTLKEKAQSQKIEWAGAVFSKLSEVLRPGDTVIILAGLEYRKFLLKPIEEIGCQVRVPMEHLKIGEQLHWLDKQLAS